MCLYPRLIKNKKYLPNKKNRGIAPRATDKRTEWVAIGCGKCIECRRQKTNEWRTRLNEEIRVDNQCYFVTLTIKPEYLTAIEQECGTENVYGQSTKIIRRFLERIRKNTGKSVKHWLIAELGHKGTERLHFHGLIWASQGVIKEAWDYCGFSFAGSEISEKTINYIVKYMLKIDEKHPEFQSRIYCSKGLGKEYVNRTAAAMNKYNGKNTREYYQLNNGYRIGLPIYYRNKIYTEAEREKLWIHRLDRQIRYIDGIEIDVSGGYERYNRLLKQAQEKNERLKYGTDEYWKLNVYEKKIREILKFGNNIVYLQNNKQDIDNYGTEKTKRSGEGTNENVEHTASNKKNGNNIHITGRLLNIQSVCNGEKQNDGLRDDTERYRNINRERIAGEMANHTYRNNANGNIIASFETMPGETMKNHETYRGDRCTYETVNITTGEIYSSKKPYEKQLKTIKYEKRSRKINRADGTKKTIWHTIRYVEEIGYEQLSLF